MKRALTGKDRLHFRLSLTLLLLSLFLALLRPSADRTWAAAAMLLSFLGDLALMDYSKLFSRLFRPPFVVGGAAFALSHGLYAACFCSLMAENGLTMSGAAIVASAVIGLAVWILIAVLSRMNSRFSAFGTVLCGIYLLFIMTHFACNVSCSVQLMAAGHTWRISSAVGVVLFLLSDLPIGLTHLAGIRRFNKWVWILYPAGQLLILLGA